VIGIIKAFFASGPDKEFRTTLHNLLGFRADNLALYRKAFTHSSATSNTRGKETVRESYERLEFLGDAVLSAVIADYLFKKFPFRDEGFLTKIRSRIVSRQQLGKLAQKFGIEKLIVAESGLTNRSHSISGDVFEALIGAIYLDKGYEFAATFIKENILRFHLDIDEIEATDHDHKSKMIEWAQKNKRELRFSLVEEIGTGQQKIFVIEVLVDGKPYGRSQHASKKRAEQEAAGVSLTALGLV
jgi:ribonuclease III